MIGRVWIAFGIVYASGRERDQLLVVEGSDHEAKGCNFVHKLLRLRPFEPRTRNSLATSQADRGRSEVWN
jgi:hypothetical protein